MPRLIAEYRQEQRQGRQVFRVTADSNIYISALQFGGLPRQFLNAARRRKRAFQLATSPALLERTARRPAQEIWLDGSHAEQ